MLTINIKGDGLALFTRATAALKSPRKAGQVFSRAINETGRVGGTAAGRALAVQTGLQKRTTLKAVRRNVTKSTPTTLTYVIHGQGGDISLKHFKPRETRIGVSAAPRGVRQVFPSSFMKAGWWPKRVAKPNWNGQVFVRANTDGYSYNAVKSNPFVKSGVFKRERTGTKFLKQKSGVFIPVEMLRGEVAKVWDQTAERLEPRVIHHINRMTGGLFK
ncbi:hypothetical protein [Shinella granuli]|uniref:Minor tail protein Z (GPZ) n=1 Tax=Shinella granuli TaxID=323621 RepID=A0A4R2BUX9_SHIGR|nr:hypothetical protein [Shinella granuli]TCN31627.1 hypothetical protein EV665_1523 [Shinella granuli]